MLRFLTSGESHGPALVAILDGFPAGLQLNTDSVNEQLRLRQQGYGRGARQKIETDQAEFIGGVRHGITTGAPISIMIRNRDWDNWKHVMSVSKPDLNLPEVTEQLDKKSISRFRPGHADLPGTFKFHQTDIRDVLERASARETAARVAVGAVCLQLLEQIGVTMAAHVLQVGSVKSARDASSLPLPELSQIAAKSEMFCIDNDAENWMKQLIKSTWQEGDSLGGIVEVLADGLPVGLGSYTQWDERLDGQIAQCLMSVQAMKAVSIGDGVDAATMLGSLVHDPIYPSADSGLPFMRKTNRAGGLEGGMTNGSRLVVRSYMKPIPTLRKGLPSVSFPEFHADTAHFERSDVCAIAAASIVCKAMVAFVLLRSLLKKFGSDHAADIKRAVDDYRLECKRKPDAANLRVAVNDEAESE
jgi:chorismate synthase